MSIINIGNFNLRIMVSFVIMEIIINLALKYTYACYTNKMHHQQFMELSQIYTNRIKLSEKL